MGNAPFQELPHSGSAALRLLHIFWAKLKMPFSDLIVREDFTFLGNLDRCCRRESLPTQKSIIL